MSFRFACDSSTLTVVAGPRRTYHISVWPSGNYAQWTYLHCDCHYWRESSMLYSPDGQIESWPRGLLRLLMEQGWTWGRQEP